MPIRINLLAEAHIAEDLRRRDPVKRAIFGGALLVALALVWSSSLLLEVMIAGNSLTQVQTEIEAHTNQWQVVVGNQKQAADNRAKLASLDQLSRVRFLNGNFLNALQKLSFNGVQLMRARVNQSYADVTEKAKKGTPKPPPKIMEQIVVSLDAKDSSTTPGDQINKFKQALAAEPYFSAMLDQTNSFQLTSLSPPQNGADGRQFVLFTLQATLTKQIE
jgi:hypothetical protein